MDELYDELNAEILAIEKKLRNIKPVVKAEVKIGDELLYYGLCEGKWRICYTAGEMMRPLTEMPGVFRIRAAENMERLYIAMQENREEYKKQLVAAIYTLKFLHGAIE